MMLKDGATAEMALGLLRWASARTMDGYRAPRYGWFAAMVDELETRLGQGFEQESVVKFLHTARYRTVVSESLRQPTMSFQAIDQEREALKTRLDALVEQYQKLATWLQNGDPVLIDTNSLLHYQQLDKIPWSTELGVPGPVRLVVPLAVVDELDRKKFEGGDKPRERARNAIRSLTELRIVARGQGALARHQCPAYAARCQACGEAVRRVAHFDRDGRIRPKRLEWEPVPDGPFVLDEHGMALRDGNGRFGVRTRYAAHSCRWTAGSA